MQRTETTTDVVTAARATIFARMIHGLTADGDARPAFEQAKRVAQAVGTERQRAILWLHQTLNHAAVTWEILIALEFDQQVVDAADTLGRRCRESVLDYASGICREEHRIVVRRRARSSSPVRPGRMGIAAVRRSRTADDGDCCNFVPGGVVSECCSCSEWAVRCPLLPARRALSPSRGCSDLSLRDNGVSMLSRARIEGRARPPRGVNPYIRAPAPTCTYDGRTSRPIPTSPPVSVRTDRGTTVPARDSDGRARRTRRPANPCRRVPVGGGTVGRLTSRS